MTGGVDPGLPIDEVVRGDEASVLRGWYGCPLRQQPAARR
jgi:hypothetical protein